MLRNLTHQRTYLSSIMILRQLSVSNFKIYLSTSPIPGIRILNCRNILNNIGYHQKNSFPTTTNYAVTYSTHKNDSLNPINNLLKYIKEKKNRNFISEMKKMVNAKSKKLNNSEAEYFAESLIELKPSFTTAQYIECLKLFPSLGLKYKDKYQKELCSSYFNRIINELSEVSNKNDQAFYFNNSLVGITKWKFSWDDFDDDNNNKAKIADWIIKLSPYFKAPGVRAVIHS